MTISISQTITVYDVEHKGRIFSVHEIVEGLNGYESYIVLEEGVELEHTDPLCIEIIDYVKGEEDAED